MPDFHVLSRSINLLCFIACRFSLCSLHDFKKQTNYWFPNINRLRNPVYLTNPKSTADDKVCYLWSI